MRCLPDTTQDDTDGDLRNDEAVGITQICTLHQMYQRKSLHGAHSNAALSILLNSIGLRSPASGRMVLTHPKPVKPKQQLGTRNKWAALSSLNGVAKALRG